MKPFRRCRELSADAVTKGTCCTRRRNSNAQDCEKASDVEVVSHKTAAMFPILGDMTSRPIDS